MPSKLAVLTDFDGTITRTAVAEAILAECAPASWWADATCTLCGTCKLLRLFQLRTEGFRMAYVGDGHSDLCPAVEADVVFAKRELAELCAEESIAYTTFVNFADVQRHLRGLT